MIRSADFTKLTNRLLPVLSASVFLGLTGCETTDPGPVETGGLGRPYNRTLSLHGIHFGLWCPNSGALNNLTITPSGLEVDNSPVTVEVDGVVTGAEVADLDGNGSPEIYVYAMSTGREAFGSLIAYATNNKKSMSPVYYPALVGDHRDSFGYQGHDEFAVVESSLVRRFPLYTVGESSPTPTGMMRQIQYKLEPGEAGWALRLDRVVEY